MVARNLSRLQEAADKMGDPVTCFVADVSVVATLEPLFQVVEERLGKIDVHFINARIARVAPIIAAPETVGDEIFATNTKGAFFTLRKAVPLLNEGDSVHPECCRAGCPGLASCRTAAFE